MSDIHKQLSKKDMKSNAPSSIDAAAHSSKDAAGGEVGGACTHGHRVPILDEDDELVGCGRLGALKT